MRMRYFYIIIGLIIAVIMSLMIISALIDVTALMSIRLRPNVESGRVH